MVKQSEKKVVKRPQAGSRVRPRLGRFFHGLLHSGKLLALLLAVIAGWVLYDALQSPRYRIRIVETVGTQALTTDDVSALANVTGKSIWDIQPNEVEARISQSAYVEHVKVRTILPDRLQVTVTERKPEVRWLHDGVAYAVTRDGLVVDRTSEPNAAPIASTTTPISATAPLSGTAPLTAEPATTAEEATPSTGVVTATAIVTPTAMAAAVANVVTIVDTTPKRTLKVGDRVDPDALEVARRVSLRAPSELPVPIKRIEWDGGLGVSLIVEDGRQVVLGGSSDLDRKMATLRYLLNQKTGFKYLDLRPSAPYYR